ncbi:MAG: methyltransferase domain-containing protein [Lentisphaeria bacterium]|nr:methyltransferase domain-containing protein [Lentisphaeria bacterium]
MTKPLFNYHANDYDNYAHIQRKIASALIEQLPASCEPKSILEVGAGTAYISKKLNRLYPDAEICVCDPAPNMIEVAKNKFTSEDKINFLCNELPKKGQFDLIVSSMAIQWVDDWDLWMSDVFKLLKPEGYLFVATPTCGTLRFLPKAFSSAKLPYSGLNYRKAEELKKSCSLFEKHSNFTQSFHENFESAINFFRKLHKIGANVSHKALSPLEFKRLLKECEKHKRDGILNARYEVTFLQARKL